MNKREAMAFLNQSIRQGKGVPIPPFVGGAWQWQDSRGGYHYSMTDGCTTIFYFDGAGHPARDLRTVDAPAIRTVPQIYDALVYNGHVANQVTLDDIRAMEQAEPDGYLISLYSDDSGVFYRIAKIHGAWYDLRLIRQAFKVLGRMVLYLAQDLKKPLTSPGYLYAASDCGEYAAVMPCRPPEMERPEDKAIAL